MQEWSEQELINGCLNREARSQELLYKKYYSILLKICARYVTNMTDAESLMNDSFLKIFNSLHTFGFQGSFEGWLKRITVNTCLDYVRSKSFMQQRATLEVKETHSGSSIHLEEDIIQELEFKKLIGYIQALPETMKLVFNLYIFENYTHKEIAVFLGVTENTSQWYLHEARKKLKEKILANKKSNTSLFKDKSVHNAKMEL